MEGTIPLELYTPIYYYVIGAVILFCFIHSKAFKIEDPKSIGFMKAIGFLLFAFTLTYMGFRPVSGKYFGDMGIYAKRFNEYVDGRTLVTVKDAAFQAFMLGMAKISNITVFFLVCAALYIVPLYRASKKMFSIYWGYAFLILIASMSFWPYGVNGIRNGISTSLFIWALTFNNKRPAFYIILILSVAVHKSMLLPIFAYFLTWLHNDTKKYLGMWVLCIPLSLLLGEFWTNLFAGLGFDERFSYFTDNSYDSEFSQTGFRWDFLIYSAIGVASGVYYIFVKNFKDVLYARFFNVYLFANAFWILVIDSGFSNRFAYLSWFSMGLIIIYPLLKEKIFTSHHSAIGNILVFYFLITFALNVIL